MRIERILMWLTAGILMLGGLTGCESPTDYTVYGIIYTDQTKSVPLANARLDFVASGYQTRGYATSNAEGKFSFFFWDDGNGNAQDISSRTKDEEVDVEPLTLSYNGKILFKGSVARDEYGTGNPMIVYPGCYTEEGGRE